MQQNVETEQKIDKTMFFYSINIIKNIDENQENGMKTMEKLTRRTLDKSMRTGYTVAIESAIEIKSAQLYL